MKVYDIKHDPKSPDRRIDELVGILEEDGYVVEEERWIRHSLQMPILTSRTKVGYIEKAHNGERLCSDNEDFIKYANSKRLRKIVKER
tara:strand:+ start:1802 stop:2065 length:264 start_codon:yes stop_codon:yes gene_type:complete